MLNLQDCRSSSTWPIRTFVTNEAASNSTPKPLSRCREDTGSLNYLLFGVNRFNMVEQSKLSKVKELECMFRDWIPKRKATVDALQVFADKLMSHHNKICIAQVTGSSASVVGFVIVTVGFGLAFVTLGTSLILSAVGGGISAAGGLTNAGSSIAEVCIQKDTFETAQKIINEGREATEAIQKL